MNQRNPTLAAQLAPPNPRRPVFWVTEYQRIYPLTARFNHDGTPVPRDGSKDRA
jgi:hypothetical protein